MTTDYASEKARSDAEQALTNAIEVVARSKDSLNEELHWLNAHGEKLEEYMRAHGEEVEEGFYQDVFETKGLITQVKQWITAAEEALDDLTDHVAKWKIPHDWD